MAEQGMQLGEGPAVRELVHFAIAEYEKLPVYMRAKATRDARLDWIANYIGTNAATRDEVVIHVDAYDRTITRRL